MAKLTRQELDRIEAYRVKCFDNALGQGRSMAYAMRAYIYSEKVAMKVVLGSTRPGEEGWWNSHRKDEAAEDALEKEEIPCQECRKVVDGVWMCDGKFRCVACVERREKIRESRPDPKYGRAAG